MMNCRYEQGAPVHKLLTEIRDIVITLECDGLVKV